jgi:hypothetical protein
MTEPDPNDELRDLDEQIDQVTSDIGSLRDQLADAGPIEPEERAAMDGLRRRRTAVSERLAGQ